MNSPILEVMTYNDKRLEAYKKVASFTPVKLTSEEAAHNNAADIAEKSDLSSNRTFSQRGASSAAVAQKPPAHLNLLGDDPDSLARALSRNGLLKIPETLKDSTYRRVAKFLLLIGVEEASRVLKHLTSDQIDKIVPEIASIRSVDRDEAVVILAEFETLMQRSRESGGVETARTILEKAFGSEMAAQMLQKSVPFPEGKPFDYLREMDGERLFHLIQDESAPVRALVLSHIKPAAAADAINRMDSQDKSETIKRLAKLQPVSPDILRRIDRAMQEKVQLQQARSGDSIDGRNALAEILRRMDTASESEILSHLSGSDPELEADLRERLFTLGDVLKVSDRYLQIKLSQMQNEDLAILIAGKPSGLRAKILSNVSKGRGDIILEEESLRKPLSRKDSERITSTFVTSLRSAWESGEFALDDNEGDVWIK